MFLKSNQNGSTLIISLMILLVLSLLGTSAMQVSTVEEKMAGNLRNANLAFQAAETALRAGEAALAAAAPANFNCADGLYPSGDFDCNGTDATPIWENANMDWTDDGLVVRYNGAGLPKQLAYTQPAYIVEQLAPVANENGSLEAAVPLTTDYYRITAWGTGGSDTAVALVQSIYKR